MDHGGSRGGPGGAQGVPQELWGIPRGIPLGAWESSWDRGVPWGSQALPEAMGDPWGPSGTTGAPRVLGVSQRLWGSRGGVRGSHGVCCRGCSPTLALPQAVALPAPGRLDAVPVPIPAPRGGRWPGGPGSPNPRLGPSLTALWGGGGPRSGQRGPGWVGGRMRRPGWARGLYCGRRPGCPAAGRGRGRGRGRGSGQGERAGGAGRGGRASAGVRGLL